MKTRGVGTELSKIIGKWITKPKNCDCNIYAGTLNKWGPDECGEKIDEIVDKLMEQDKHLPLHLRLFPDLVKKTTLTLMVKQAIKNTRDKKS
tara:strand:+ start:5689 stop:5964 length:276 start_codon:yes stop_codon:yes gene_type:complete